MGGDLGLDWGDGPPKNLRCGDGPCIRPPIFREVTLSHACESKNRVKKVSCTKEFFSEIVSFSREERAIYVISHLTQ